jgi:ComEC/Rec2-related protein
MWVFCLCCLFSMHFSSFFCFSYLSKNLVFLQQWCFNSMPVQQADQVLWQALVCARPISHHDKWKSWLQLSGLIHLFIVSGSHFIVLQWILEKIRAPKTFQFVILWVYNALTGFSPPGTRACMGISLSFLFKIRSEQKLWAISLICLALQPTWLTSYSFWLSWLASLILVVTPTFKFDLIRNIIFYGIWVLLGFTITPWSIPLNLIIGPLITWVLFPLAFLSYLPGVSMIFHWSVLILQFILEKLFNKISAPSFPNFLWQLAGLVLLTHLILQLRRLQWQGQKIN